MTTLYNDRRTFSSRCTLEFKDISEDDAKVINDALASGETINVTLYGWDGPRPKGIVKAISPLTEVS